MRYSQFKIVERDTIDKERLKKIDRITRKLQSDPDLVDEIFKQISTKAKDIEGNFINRFVSMLDPEKTTPEKDQTFADFLKKYAEIISEVESTTEEKFAFIGNLGKKSYVDVGKLMQPGKSSWDSWLSKDSFARKLFDRAFGDPRLITDNKGPGEAALAILSPDIKLALGGAGDLEIKGKPIEVKASASAKKGSGGGRLTPTKNTLGVLQAQDVGKYLFPQDKVQQQAIIENYRNCSSRKFPQFVADFNLDSQQINGLLSQIFKEPTIQDMVAEVSKKGKNITSKDLVQLSIFNYGRSQNDEHFLMLEKASRTSFYFDIDNWDLPGFGYSLNVFGSDLRSTGQTQIYIMSRV